jgi:hypothetical protein
MKLNELANNYVTMGNFPSFTSTHAHARTHAHTYSVARVREQTIPTEQPSLAGEVSANFCG